MDCFDSLVNFFSELSLVPKITVHFELNSGNSDRGSQTDSFWMKVRSTMNGKGRQAKLSATMSTPGQIRQYQFVLTSA